MAHIEWIEDHNELYSLNTPYDQPIWSSVTDSVIGVVRRANKDDNEQFDLNAEHEKYLIAWLKKQRDAR